MPATLPGYAHPGLGGAWGLVPDVPDPTQTAGQAIAGDIANLPGLQNLAGQINRFNTGEAIAPYIANLPNYQAMVGQSSNNILDLLRGQIPADVMDLLGQQGAERGVMMGSPGSPNTNAAVLRNLGLTSLGLQQQGEGELTGAIQRTPVPQLFNVASFLTSPEDQQAAQMAANLYAAAPDPTQQANELLRLLREAMAAQQAAGTGGRPGVSFAPPSGGFGSQRGPLPGSGGSDTVGGGGGPSGYHAAPPDPNRALYPITGHPPAAGGAGSPGGVSFGGGPGSIFGPGGIGSIYGAGGAGDPLRNLPGNFGFGNLFGGGGAQDPFGSLFGGGGIGDLFSAGGGNDPFANEPQGFQFGDLFGNRGLGEIYGAGSLADPFSPGNQSFNFGDLFGDYGLGDILGAGGLGDPFRNAGTGQAPAEDPWWLLPGEDYYSYEDVFGPSGGLNDIGSIFGAGGLGDPLAPGNEFGAPIGGAPAPEPFDWSNYGWADYFDEGGGP